MKKTLKSILIFVVLTAFVVPLLIGCPSNDPNPIDERPTDINEENENRDDLLMHELPPDLNFNGQEFRIHNTRRDHNPFVLTVITVEEDTGEALDTAIFRRNQRVEELLNIRIVETPHDNPGSVNNRVRQSVNAASDDLELAICAAVDAFRLAQGNMIIPLDRVPFVNLEKGYWDQNMIRDLSIGDRVHFLTGDFSLNAYAATVVFFFNKDLKMTLGLPDFYDLVRRGEWTLDRFEEFIAVATMDLNNDGIINFNDRIGFVSWHGYRVNFLSGAGQNFITRDENNFPVMGFDNETFIDAFRRVFDIMTTSNVFYGPGQQANLVFQESRILFWADLLHWANSLRGMEADFGVLPFPKLNAQQENYVSTTGNIHVFVIPRTNTNLQMTGAVLEALNSDSARNVVEVYFENLVKGKNLNRDEESWEMLDEFIFNNRKYDITRFYFEDVILNPHNNLFANRDRDISAFIEARRNTINAAIERSIAVFMEE